MKRVERSYDIGKFIPEADDDLLICRCEEITKGEIRQAIHAGMFTMAEIRRYLRCGMGLCQGQTCGKLVKKIIAKELGKASNTITEATSRSPMRPIEMAVYGNEEGR